MLKFVLLFIAVTIAGTEEDCSTSTRWNLCFGIMKELLQVKDNQEHMCNLATKAVSCFEQSVCIPEKDWEYIISVLRDCGQQICSHSGSSLCIGIVDVIMIDLRVKVLQTNEGKEYMCSLAKMAEKCFNQARCVQPRAVLDIVAGCVNSKETDCDVTKALKCRERTKNYSDVCSWRYFEQLMYCYPHRECDALYEMEEIYLKRLCEKCRSKDSKVCVELMDDVIQINQSESFACSLAEIVVSCFKAAGCPPMQNAVDIFAGCEAKDCDLHNVYKCRDTMDKYLDLCNEEHLEQIKPCYTNNKCDALFESIAISLKKLCSQEKTVKQ